ncbi:MAG: hypothetical protein NZ990_16180 [Myxococcota bacterium]|nr:hypothetical protein [Myxococcota bacterium]
MLKFRTDIRTVSQMQEMMDQWMSVKGRSLELELSGSQWMRKLGDFTMAFDLDYLRKYKETDTRVICELAGMAPTKKVLIYRFLCQFENSLGETPVVMDIEEGIYDRACRMGRWEVIPRRSTVIPVSTGERPMPGKPDAARS